MSITEVHLIAEIAAYVILVVAFWSGVMLIMCLGRAFDEMIDERIDSLTQHGE